LLDALKKDQCHDQEIKDRLLKSKSTETLKSDPWSFFRSRVLTDIVDHLAKLLKKRKGSTDWDALLESWMSLMVPTN